ncbi:hypothetical protein DIS24_g11090 [Lasiodiplodia hormozganensis]|uniref:Uncharacterized protein n=1 Tax=Lasiodiplodia hormozganensis TaxID=869390 RepID=A0AA39X1I9_9PEZI|nr:hypothetical protein DIS24_g11090 [Lasiodiplodia hormozganensis]
MTKRPFVPDGFSALQPRRTPRQRRTEPTLFINHTISEDNSKETACSRLLALAPRNDLRDYKDKLHAREERIAPEDDDRSGSPIKEFERKNNLMGVVTKSRRNSISEESEASDEPAPVRSDSLDNISANIGTGAVNMASLTPEQQQQFHRQRSQMIVKRIAAHVSGNIPLQIQQMIRGGSIMQAWQMVVQQQQAQKQTNQHQQQGDQRGMSMGGGAVDRPAGIKGMNTMSGEGTTIQEMEQMQMRLQQQQAAAEQHGGAGHRAYMARLQRQQQILTQRQAQQQLQQQLNMINGNINPLSGALDSGYNRHQSQMNPPPPQPMLSSQAPHADGSQALSSSNLMNSHSLRPHRTLQHPRSQKPRTSTDPYGFPATHSAHSSISSASTYPAFYNGSNSSVVDSSVTNHSSVSESVGGMSSRTLPRPSAVVGTNLPPPPQSMMRHINSKVSSSSQKKHKSSASDYR